MIALTVSMALCTLPNVGWVPAAWNARLHYRDTMHAAIDTAIDFLQSRRLHGYLVTHGCGLLQPLNPV